MLLNSLYKGELIWGKTETYKDHETGIRKRYRRNSGMSPMAYDHLVPPESGLNTAAQAGNGCSRRPPAVRTSSGA
jgi:hypothetical protein